jgi:uncharacterized protein YdaU (DUF1376 family)
MAIQKPEWFKLDAAKFLADAQVDAMSTLELGACFRLLCRQWIDGSIPDDLGLLARLCRLEAEAMTRAWVTLGPFFPTIERGKRANRFMWMEREKVVTELLRKSDAGTRAARIRWDDARNRLDAGYDAGGIGHPMRSDATPNASGMPNAMQDQSRPDQSRPEKISSSEQKGCSDPATPRTKKTDTEPSREAVKLADLLQAEILRNVPGFKTTQAQLRSWEATADRMLRLDGRDPERAAELIQWAQHDDFWLSNILSMEKLRKNFDQLEAKASSKNGKSHHRPTLGVAAKMVAQKNSLGMIPSNGRAS